MPGLRMIDRARPTYGGSNPLTFARPAAATKGRLLVALIVREHAVAAPVGWMLVQSLGAGAFVLDVHARLVEDGEAEAYVFTTATPHEMQGQLLLLEGGTPAALREASASSAFAADATPDTPASSSLQATSLGLCVWSAGAAVALTPPAGFTLIDTYSTNYVAPRTLLVAYKVIGATGAFAPAAAASAPASTGRAWTYVLRAAPPAIPAALSDPVPGNIGFFGKDVRIGR